MALRLCIKEVAESQGKNMSQLARSADVGFTTVRRMWYNTASGTPNDDQRLENVNLPALEKIANALHVEPQDLIVKE